jgi:UDP-N-acetylglucosamine--N-acetylmuramyl-(pentapeptide) pyrophosphoryl-undecaprenol N-acetylglucosamine transferase
MSAGADRSKRLLIAGGGTGGHVIPAIAVAKEWLRREPEGVRSVVIVGTERGMETRLVPKAGLPLETIRAAGLKGIGGMKLVKNAAKVPIGMIDSFRILSEHKFGVAFGVGGYASGPMILAARLTGVPSVVFEPNVEPGFTNRVLAGFSTQIAVGFKETAQRLGRKAVVTGIPVRKEFFAIPDRARDTAASGGAFNILITGGSSGALPINRAVIDSLDILSSRKNQLFIVHQTGERDYNAVRVAYARREFRAEVVPFIENMAERFAQADLIVCRSGAITVAEVAAAGRAAIFIPFGAATDAHQMLNASAMRDAGASRVIPQPELTPERLTTEIFSLLDQPSLTSEMSQNARKLARPRAVEDMVDMLEGLVRQ